MKEEKLKLLSQLIVCLSLAPCISEVAQGSSKKVSAVCEQHINDVSEKVGVPSGLLYAVALTETGSGGKLNPYALNIEGKTVIGKSQADAILLFRAARQDQKVLIDVGCMQVNYYWHHTGFQKVEDMFDPKQNISYAATMLKSAHSKHGSWTEAVARYHAGPHNKVAQRRYVCRVLNNLVKANFGGWTPEAKSYCAPEAQ
jgi:Transglycosylase SLT domain